MMQEDLLMDNKSFQKKQDFKKVESHKKSFVVSNYKDDEKKSDSVGERKNEKLEHFFEQENEEKTSKYKSLEDEQEEGKF